MIDVANWAWPQLVYLALLLLSFGISIASHGKKVESKHNFWLKFALSSFILSLLVFGGFFA